MSARFAMASAEVFLKVLSPNSIMALLRMRSCRSSGREKNLSFTRLPPFPPTIPPLTKSVNPLNAKRSPQEAPCGEFLYGHHAPADCGDSGHSPAARCTAQFSTPKNVEDTDGPIPSTTPG